MGDMRKDYVSERFMIVSKKNDKVKVQVKSGIFEYQIIIIK
jgi:UDPglucose--hexose-1-phosphate uridylyltransferase